MGKDPYGFMGRYQAIPGGLDSCGIANALFAYALDEDSVKDAAIDAFILAVRKSGSFSRSNELAKYLPKISQLSAAQEAALVQAFNDNNQVHHAFEWTDVVERLKTWTGNDYVVDKHQLRPFVSKDDLPF